MEHKCHARCGRQSGCHLLRTVARYSRELLFVAYNSCAVGIMGTGPPSRSLRSRGSAGQIGAMFYPPAVFIRRPPGRQEVGGEMYPPVGFYPPASRERFVILTDVFIRRPTMIRLANL